MKSNIFNIHFLNINRKENETADKRMEKGCLSSIIIFWFEIL